MSDLQNPKTMILLHIAESSLNLRKSSKPKNIIRNLKKKHARLLDTTQNTEANKCDIHLNLDILFHQPFPYPVMAPPNPVGWTPRMGKS